MDMLEFLTRRLVTSVDFYEAPPSSTLTCLYECCLLLNFVRTKIIIQTGALLYEVGNTHRILVYAHTTLIMEVKPCTEVTL